MLNDPILAVAVRAARRAGSIVVDAARDLKRLAAHAKDQGNIATTAVSEAGKAIVATLRAAFPGHAIHGEEPADETLAPSGAHPPAPGYRWIVDPIDGGTNFTHCYPYYAVSIALMHGQEITHAVVHDPVHDELFMAIRGKGAQLNGVAIRVSTCTTLAHALVATVFPKPGHARMPAFLSVFNAMLPQCAGIRPAGAGALDLAYLAAGRLDAFWVMSVQPWDIAAGALLVREAGGRVGDFTGGGEFLRTNEMIATAPGIFSALRESIVAALPAR